MKPPVTVALGPGVTSTVAAGSAAYASGTQVAYKFEAAAGRRNVRVLLDSTEVTSAGVVTLSADRKLYAAADTVIEVAQTAEPLLTQTRALLTAPDPVAAFQSLVNANADLTSRLGNAAAHDQLAALSATAYDIARDSTALRRVDEALGGKVFSVALPTSATTSVLRASHAQTSAFEAGPRVSAATASRRPTVLLYVNGFRNDPAMAARTTVALAEFAITNGILAPDGSDRVDYFYNSAWRTMAGAEAAACLYLAASSGTEGLQLLNLLTGV